MLIACQSCHRQYDVGDLEPGSKVRCTCGALNEVPRRRGRRRAVSYCANCGGQRAGDGPCAYCAAVPATPEAEQQWPCPECFARLEDGARFCHACGVAIRPESVVRAVTRHACPRCAGKLVLAEGRGDPFHQCTGCGGTWLDLRAFQRFVERSVGRAVRPEEERAVSLAVRTRPGSSPGARSGEGRGVRRRRPRARRKAPRPIACPTCGGLMLVTHYAQYSGIEVDSCLRHGWWFDADELRRIAEFLAGGGLAEVERRRRASARARRTALSWRRRVEAERGENGLDGVFGLVLGLLAGEPD